MARELHRAEFASFVVRAVGYAAGERMPRHAHGYSNITAVIAGEIAEVVESGEHRGLPSSVLLKPAGTDHANATPGRKGALTVSVQVAADSPLVRSWSWFDDGPSASAALNLYGALLSRDKAAVETHAYALLGGATAAAELRARKRPAWIDDLTAMLAQRIDEPLRFEELAHTIGLHPVYLSRAFRRHVGTTMQEFIRSLRISRAQHLLSTTERAINSVAAAAGFADPSHLCRSFKETCSITPKAYRRMIEV